MKSIILILAMTNMYGDKMYSEAVAPSMDQCTQMLEYIIKDFVVLEQLEKDIGMYPEKILTLDQAECKEM